jgi:hypothetical protein
MPNGFDYEQISQILANNASQILTDNAHGLGICAASGPTVPENAERLTPSAIHFDLSNSIISAVYEFDTDQGKSFIVTLSCKGPGEAEVLPNAVNLLFSWDLANEYGGDPDFVTNYVKYLINSKNTSEHERLQVAIWGGSEFTIPDRPDSQARAIYARENGINKIFFKWADGDLANDPFFPETTYEYARQILSSNFIVVHSPDYYP